MPTVRISQGGRKVPSSSGLPFQSPVQQPQALEARALGQAAAELGAIADKELDKQKLALESDYLNSSSVSLTESISQIQEEESQGPINGLTERIMGRVDTLFENTAEGAPTAESRRSIQNIMTNKRNSLFLNSKAFEKRKAADSYVASHEASLGRLENILMRDPSKMAEAIADNEILLATADRFLDSEDLNKIRDKSSEALTLAYTEGMLNKDPQSVLQSVNNGEYDDLDPKQVQAIKRSAEMRIEDAQQELTRAQTKQHREYVDGVKGRIVLGDVTPIELHTAFAEGNITGQEFSTLTNQLNSVSKLKKKDTASIAMVQQAMQTGTPLDITDTETQNAINIHFDNIVAESARGEEDPNVGRGIIMSYINEHNYVPKSLKKTLLGNLNNGDINQKVAAAVFIDELQSGNPIINKSLGGQAAGKQTVARSTKIVSALEAGMKPEDAVKASEIQYSESHTKEFKDRTKQWEEESGSIDINEFLGDRGFVTELLTDDPNEIPAEMDNQFNELYKDFAVTFGMDDASARKAAYKILRQHWGQTTINDPSEPEFMRDAPELYYSVKGVPNRWMRDQLLHEVSPFISEGMDRDDIFLQPNPNSADPSKPDYIVFRVDTDGQPMPLLDGEGNPVPWRPDYQEYLKIPAKDFNKKRLEAMADKVVFDTLKREIGIGATEVTKTSQDGLIPGEFK